MKAQSLVLLLSFLIVSFFLSFSFFFLSSFPCCLYVHPTNIPRTGITGVTKADLDAAAEKGCVIKLIAKATLDEEGALDCSVSPTELPKSHPLAGVSNEFNAIFLTGNAVDDVMFYGKGAGPATGSAIVGDIIAIMKALQK